MVVTTETDVRDFAVRLAGANHSRRLYGMKGQAWERTLNALGAELDRFFETGGAGEVTVALLSDGLAVQGIPISDPPSSVLRFVGHLKQRDVEIISFRRGISVSELETLLAFLGADSADVAAVKADTWLRERGVEHINIKHLRLMRGEGVESFRDVYWRGKRVLKRQFERAAQEGDINVAAVGELARSLMEVILESDAPVATLLALQDRDDFSLVHSVNVATLAGSQASTLQLTESEVQEIVVASLMHDIGKTKVPDAILSYGRPLPPKEKAILDRHTIEGARLLMDVPGSSPLAAVVALHHHGVAPPGTPGLAANEICKIGDAFDSIRTLRPFDDAASMRGAVAYMARKMGERFNPYLMERFAKMVGIGQRDEHVWLTTGEVAVILEPHPELAFHPVVEVVDTRRGRLAPGAQRDLAERVGQGNARRAVPAIPKHISNLTPEEVDALG